MKSFIPIGSCILVLIGAIQLGGCVAAVGAGAAAGAAAAYDRRTAGTLIDDQLIEVKLLSSLLDDPALNAQAHINATSYNNVVLLSGEVPDQTLKARAESIARRLPKVRSVHNELMLAAPSSLLTRSSDSLVTGKVKSSLISDELAQAGRIKVVTENGTVFLLGLVTRGEGGRATEITRRVGGVQRVVKLFEYLD
jgi:osmotically-inducible protein OsmY